MMKQWIPSIERNEKMGIKWEQFEAEAKGKKVFLFGVGADSKLFWLKYDNQIRLTGVIDNDKKKQGYAIGDLVIEAWDTQNGRLPISDISILDCYDKNEIVVLIASRKYYKQIIEQLASYDVFKYFVISIMEANEGNNAADLDITIDNESAKAEYAKVCCKKPINIRKIVFYSFRSYSDHGKYIAEALLKTKQELDLVFFVKDLGTVVPEGVRKVFIGNWKKYIYEMETAGTWIYNMVAPDYIIKRPGQIYIQTKHWASVTLKKFYLDASTINVVHKRVDNWKYNSKIMDYIITGSDFDTESCRRGFDFHGEVVQVGSPRSDAMFRQEKYKKKICQHYHIKASTKLLIYAPTYRFQQGSTDYKHEFKLTDLDLGRVRVTLEQNFGGEWNILLRLHPSVTKESIYMHKPAGVIDVSGYEDSEELVSACDMMISDYSSIMFEPAFVKKPVFLFAPDREEYIDKEYDLLIDYDTLPFPIALSNEELLTKIKQFDKAEYDRNVTDFLQKYGVCEDGHASERAAEFILRLIAERE